MSVANDGIARNGAVPLNRIGTSYIQTRANGPTVIGPLAAITDAVGINYLELTGNYIDFHSGTAPVAIDYEARISTSGIAVEQGGSNMILSLKQLFVNSLDMDVFNNTAGNFVIPSPAPFFATYTLGDLVTGLDLPAPIEGQRFFINNNSGNDLPTNLNGAVPENALGGGQGNLPPFPAGDMPSEVTYLMVSVQQGAIGDYIWKVYGVAQIVGTTPYGADGTVLTMVAGKPAWA